MPKMGVLRASEGYYFHCFTIKSIGSRGPTPQATRRRSPAGAVARPWLGITGIPVTPGLAQGLQLNVRQGVLVVEVIRGSPAYQAGLRGGNKEAIVGGMRLFLGGDIITSIDGNRIADMKELVQVLAKKRVGQTATLRIMRNDMRMELSVLLSERP